MSERTVAAETSMSASRTTCAEPIGCPVWMCSEITRRRIVDFLASSTGSCDATCLPRLTLPEGVPLAAHPVSALDSTEC